jgi:hypothetical protein
MIVGRSWIAVIAALSAGCVQSARAPELGGAEAALGSAQEIVVPEDPGAAYYLTLASRELARARALQGLHDVDGTRGWARRAQADADVARMRGVEAATRAAAQRTEDDAMAIERAIEDAR